MTARLATRLTLALATVVVAACSTPDASFGPRTFANNDVGTSPNDDVVTVCKIGPIGTTATFSVSATGGNLLQGSSLTVLLAPPLATPFDGDSTVRLLCTDVWQSTGAEESVTVTETGASAGVELYRITTYSLGMWSVNYEPTIPTATVRASSTSAATVWFKNRYSDIRLGTQGCTPGYWRQKQHFDSWTAPYTPTTAFGSVFADAFPGKTLLDVVKLGGGGLNALGRHTVAALLNAASPNEDYGATQAAVIAAFNAAYASGDYETQKNVFAAWNERGCPLN